MIPSSAELNVLTMKKVNVFALLICAGTLIAGFLHHKYTINAYQDIERANSHTVLAVHRVNSEAKLDELRDKGISNIEIDVFVDNGRVMVGHELASASSLTLEQYFDIVHKKIPDFGFIWLDMKDLNIANESLIYNTLMTLDRLYRIKHRVLIESRYIDALPRFVREGWSTGYYLRYELAAQNPAYFADVIKALDATGVETVTFDCKFKSIAEHYFLNVSLASGSRVRMNCWDLDTVRWHKRTVRNYSNMHTVLVGVKTKNNL